MSPEKMVEISPRLYRIQARSAGETAFLELARRQAGQVFGVTSRGIFIRTGAGGLIFLSFEEYRGPLTINLPEPFAPFQALQNSERVSTGKARLQIPAAHIEVVTAPAIVWHIPPPDLGRMAAWQARLESCRNLAGLVNPEKKNAGLGALLPALLARPEETPGSELDAALQSLWPEAIRLRQALQEKNLSAVLGSLSAFLGCGRGLTPSGDDFVMGLLLMINRWGISTWEDAWRSALSEKVILAANQKTTALSARLIACAACPSAPQADERLVDVVDYICTGCGDAAGLAAALSGWGSSSGIDALAGMTLAVLSSAQ